MRISTKLILILVTAIIMVMGAYALFTISRTQDRLTEEMLKMAEHISLALNVGVLHHLEDGDIEGVKEVVDQISKYEDITGAAIFNTEGKMVAASQEIALELAGEQQIYMDVAGLGQHSGESIGSRVYTYRMRIDSGHGRLLGSLRLILGEHSMLPHVIEARNYILLTILAMTSLITILIVYFSQTQIAGPLKILTEGALTIGQGELAHRINLKGGGEIGELATAFNSMASNLELATREIVGEREYIRNIIDSITEGIVVINKDAQITAWNQTMEQRYGLPLEKVLGSPLENVFSDLYTHEFETSFQRLLSGVLPQFGLYKVALEKMPERVLSLAVSSLRNADSSVDGAVLVLSDITERMRLEQQVQQSEKLAAVGQLAAGMAHEIGTPLNVISGSAEYLLMDEGEVEHTDELKTIVSEVGRISELVQQLLAFARQEEPKEEIVELESLVEAVLVLLRHQIEKKNIIIDVEKIAGLPEISVDRNQIHQVLLNLVINAWQAMPEGGKLSLEGHYRPPEVEASNDGEIGYIELRIRDTGEGIAEENIEKIYDPFFTTKEVGSGTGLGLAIVRRIVENHGGSIEVESRIGEGTTFTLSFPSYGKECDNG
ncbi:MAG: PAS domain S-box-containing protein [Candidatus Latescibacterota bacterium]|jgi:PAS domain S-box-containing protein